MCDHSCVMMMMISSCVSCVIIGQQLCELCVINGLPNEFPLNTALCEVEIDRAEETVRLHRPCEE